MHKTPVSILQEMMVKKGKVPNYHLIHDGGGSHENTFTYELCCEGLKARGTGRCKKDAKHTAAKNMLETIANHNALPALPASPAKSPVRTPLPKPMPKPHILQPDEPFINAIGELKDLCAEVELAEPIYKTISDIGPPHARVFTIQCIVSSFKEEGKSTTKKQAKHDAARKMFMRIKELTKNSTNALENHTFQQENISTDSVTITYSNAYYQKKVSLGVKLADYHILLINNYDLEIRQQIVSELTDWRNNWSGESNENEDLFEKLNEKLKIILLPLNIDTKKFVMKIDDKIFFLSIYVSSTPEIVQIEIGDNINQLIEKAFYNIIDKFIELLLCHR